MKDAERLALLLRQLLKQMVEQGGDPTGDPLRVSVDAERALAKRAQAILEASAAEIRREMTVPGHEPPRVVAGVDKAAQGKASLWLELATG